MNKKGLLVLTFITLVLLINLVLAAEADYIISNSEDWRDVYSTTLYANLLGKSNSFLVSQRHSTLLLNSISKGTTVQVISSEEVPFAIGYENVIESSGYPDAEELELDNVNLGLANLLTNINNFIIIDDSYGYNAIAVAPYAVLKKSYVLFADRNNIDDVESFLSSKDVNELIIYGHVDREVREFLTNYNPLYIGTGDRFDDNVEIVKRYRDINPTKQIILSNGEFIEKEIMSGVEPVLFVGKENVPEQIKEYIKSTDIEVAVLIGNELVGTATNVRRDVGISTFVKFAQGARNPAGAIAAVEGLDLFYLPTYTLDLEISSIKLNIATNQLEVTYRSKSDVAIYFKGTITLISDAGESKRVGDQESIFIDSNELKTVVYADMNLQGNSFTAEVFTIYGESRNSLEKTIDATFEVSVVNVIDNCNIEIKEVNYHTSRKSFFVKIENVGEEECYVDIELPDVLIADEKVTLSLESVARLDSGESKSLPVKSELTDYDIDKNKFVDIIVYYGQREDSLTKILKGRLELILKKFDIVYYTLLLVVALLIIGLIILYKRRKNKK